MMTVRRLLPLAALLVVAGLVLAQPPAKTANPEPKSAPKEHPRPAPGSLEDTLDKSLRNSADIKAAEAKVREAEAELNRVRQQVLTRATALHADLNLAKRMLTVAEQSLAINERANKSGQVGLEALLAAQAMVEKHRGEVEKLEAELKSLRGEFAIRGYSSVAFSPDGQALWTGLSDGTVRVWDVNDKAAPYPLTGVKMNAGPAAPSVKAPMLDRVKKLLDKEVDFQVDHPIPDAVRRLLDAAGTDVPLRELLPKVEPVTVSLRAKMPLGAWLQAVEDSDPDVRIVVRDYGFLLTTRAGVPDGALRVQDLWKGNNSELTKPADAKAPKQ
jgi:hypothetical protein